MPAPVNPKTPAAPKALLRERKIAAALAMRGWSQQRLAREISRGRTAVSRAIKHGECGPTLNLILTTLEIR